jgi:hypothetical protein
MKIYINRKNVQAVENAKLPVRKPGDLFSRRQKWKKDLCFEGFVLLPGLQNVYDCMYGRCSHLRTVFKNRIEIFVT